MNDARDTGGIAGGRFIEVTEFPTGVVADHADIADAMTPPGGAMARNGPWKGHREGDMMVASQDAAASSPKKNAAKKKKKRGSYASPGSNHGGASPKRRGRKRGGRATPKSGRSRSKSRGGKEDGVTPVGSKEWTTRIHARADAEGESAVAAIHATKEEASKEVKDAAYFSSLRVVDLKPVGRFFPF